ncbi:MAG: hypothetical protein JW891_00020 [Candidatus Lokiarchaeota archaeon]|nr:hypothetical protein [Candidatus Lokiarchaeota archaeon]
MTVSISKQQDIVLKVIQDYLDNNRALNLEKVIPYIRNILSKKKININSNGIKLIIKNLVEQRHIIQGSKLTRDDVLNNENRRNTYETIKNNPGCYFNFLRKRLNLSNHIIAWHLNILMKFEYIKKASLDNHDIFFSTEVKSKDYEKLYLLSKKKCKRMLSFMKDFDDGITKTMVSTNLGIHYNIVSKYFEKLLKVGIINKKSFSNKTTYFLKQKYISLV